MSIQKKKNYVRYTTFGFLLGMVIWRFCYRSVYSARSYAQRWINYLGLAGGEHNVSWLEVELNGQPDDDLIAAWTVSLMIWNMRWTVWPAHLDDENTGNTDTLQELWTPCFSRISPQEKDRLLVEDHPRVRQFDIIQGYVFYADASGCV